MGISRSLKNIYVYLSSWLSSRQGKEMTNEIGTISEVIGVLLVRVTGPNGVQFRE